MRTPRPWETTTIPDEPAPSPRASKSRVIPIAKAKVDPAPVPTTFVTPPLKSWSFSSLSDFERCKYYSFLKRVEKIPEPERALPPGKSEHANDRGSRIHDQAEMFVRGTGKFASEMRSFETEFNALQRLFSQGQVQLEGEWGMSKDWEPADWKKAWLRLKLDALVFLSPEEAVAIDYKTGRRFGNEFKHAEQVQLYSLVTLLRYPQLNTVHTELWYLDQDEMAGMTVHRHQGLRFRQKWDERGNRMTSAVDFPANPNVFTCKYCMYGPRGSGICERGV